MAEHEVTIYRHPNPEIRSFLTREPLSPPTLWVGRRPFESEDIARLKRLDLVAAQLIRNLAEIPGIEEIRLKPKEIRVKKIPDASWEQIEARALQDIRGALRRRKLHLVSRG